VTKERTFLRPRKQPPEVAAADARMAAAKARFSLAALACLRAAPDAAELVRKALAEVDAARAALSEVEA